MSAPEAAPRPPTGRVFAALVGVSGFLAVAGWIARRLDPLTDRGTAHHLLLRFDLAQEDGLATWFSCALFLAIAGLAWGRWRAAAAFRRRWLGLAGIGLACSAEQVVQFAVVVAPVLDWRLGPVWLVAPTLGLIGLAALYVPWLRARPPAVARSIGAGVALGLVGAIGLELLGQRLAGAVPPPLWDVVLSLEEGCELVGLSLVVRGLLLEGEAGAAGAPLPPRSRSGL